ncbi:MAG: M1 family aminopeptidase [Longimicrobiales bacterium]|nr:M1 family aminopeptidase [Longimicrobiales bacterium]
MTRTRRCVRVAAPLPLLLLLLPLPAAPQEASDLGAWVQSVRSARPDPSRVAEVDDLTLERDEGTFHFASGTMHLMEPVDGRTLGAVFVGEGTFRMDAPIEIEQEHIRRLMESDGVERRFRRAVLLFTDFTDNELAGQLDFGPGEPHGDARREIEEAMKYVSDDDGWFAEDVMTPLLNRVGGFFYAHFGWDRGDPLIFTVNPASFEEVALYRKLDGRGEYREVVSRFHRRSDYETGQSMPQEALDLVRVDGCNIEAWIEGNLDFRARAALRLTPLGEYRWVHLTLHPELDVDALRWGDGSPVEHYRPKESSALWVDLESAPEGPLELVAEYHGDILEQEERLWVRVIANRSWFPVYEYDRLVPYRVTFHTHEKLRVATVGSLLSETPEGDHVTTVWETSPVRQMTFNVGEFDEHRPEDLTGRSLLLQYDERAHKRLERLAADANLVVFGQREMGEMVSDDLTRAFQFFDQVFGETPVRDFIATETPYSHGEAYPGLVLLPWTTFQYTSTKGYDAIFRAHEVAHQWWGIGVRPATYRDQWLAEGFSEFAGLFYAARVNGSVATYNEWLDEMREEILDRRDEAPPIALGPRAATVRNPGDHQLIVYKKGAWVLHMLRMLLTDFEGDGADQLFDRVIKAFYTERYGQSATTEHFRAIVEREVGAEMGWFFDQWVFGSAIPRYTFSYTLEDQPDGSVKARIRVRQEEVPDDFRMVVPILLDFGEDGTAVVRINVTGPVTEGELPLLPQRPERLEFNPFQAVLAETKTERWRR